MLRLVKQIISNKAEISNAGKKSDEEKINNMINFYFEVFFFRK